MSVCDFASSAFSSRQQCAANMIIYLFYTLMAICAIATKVWSCGVTTLFTRHLCARQFQTSQNTRGLQQQKQSQRS